MKAVVRDREAAEVLRAFLRVHGFDTKTETDYARMLHEAINTHTVNILSAFGSGMVDAFKILCTRREEP